MRPFPIRFLRGLGRKTSKSEELQTKVVHFIYATYGRILRTVRFEGFAGALLWLTIHLPH
jgi:hypothetical protein